MIVNEYEMETLFSVRPSDTLPSHDASDVPNMPNQRLKTGHYFFDKCLYTNEVLKATPSSL